MGVEIKILNDLEFGITPTCRRYGLNEKEFLAAINQMKGKGLIAFEATKEVLSNGEPKIIYLLDKGKQYLKSN
jgi:hypothetical protein